MLPSGRRWVKTKGALVKALYDNAKEIPELAKSAIELTERSDKNEFFGRFMLC